MHVKKVMDTLSDRFVSIGALCMLPEMHVVNECVAAIIMLNVVSRF